MQVGKLIPAFRFNQKPKLPGFLWKWLLSDRGSNILAGNRDGFSRRSLDKLSRFIRCFWVRLFFVITFQAIFESPDAAAQLTSDLSNSTDTKNQDDDHQDDDQFHWTNSIHFLTCLYH